MGLSLAIRADPAPLATSDLDWLRGRTIVHKMVIGLTDPKACMTALLDELGRTSGEIRSLTLKPTAHDCFEVVLQATALSVDEARNLVGRFASHPEVNSAAIEHVLIR